MEIITLDNGLRLVTDTRPGVSSAVFGVTTRVGSRDEDEGQHGLAHFVEHTIFKGTSRLSASRIINTLESVGGELNAFTSKDETVVYSVIAAGELRRAARLITQLVTDSVFPQDEIDREREVICDEIDMYRDNPMDAVNDDFEDLIFAGTSLGHNILGTEDSVRRISGDTCREYLDKYYRAGNMVAFYSGPWSAKQVVRSISRHLQTIKSGVPVRTTETVPINGQFDVSRNADTHQSHVVSGMRTPGMNDTGRFAAALAANVLCGPGMNSLLNVALRERRGLVYSVEGSTTLLADCGHTSIYYGCDPSDVLTCRRIVRRTIDKMSQDVPTQIALQKAVKQYLGQLSVSADNRENAIFGAARSLLFRGYVSDAADTAEHIKAVTPSDYLEAAQRFTDLSILTLGKKFGR